jgi:hypothetical protein
MGVSETLESATQQKSWTWRGVGGTELARYAMLAAPNPEVLDFLQRAALGFR